MAYIPVRFGHTRLARPHAVPTRALIELRRWGERSILADFTLFDADGAAVAHLHDARFQGARVRRVNLLADKALVTQSVAVDGGALGLSGAGIARSAVVAAGQARSEGRDGGQWLLEGWADAVGLALARRLADGDLISPERLREWEPALATWFVDILNSLAASGFVAQTEAGWRIDAAAALPAPDMVLGAIADEHPDRSAELLLAGRVTAMAGAPLDPGRVPAAQPGTIDNYEFGGTSVRRSSEFLTGLLDRAGALCRSPRALRILQVGYGPLSHSLAEASVEAEFRLTVLDLDRRRIERAKLALRQGICVVRRRRR